MKIKSNLKLITLLLSCTFLFQSCKIYHSKNVSIADAVMVPQKVKIKSNTNETYRFERLQKENNQLYGVAKRNSKTGKKLKDLSVDTNTKSKYIQVPLTNDMVKEIHIKNKALSTTGNIAMGGLVAGLAGLGILFVLILL